MEEQKRSKYWNELVDILDSQFPKGECKERGHALVLLAYAEIAIREALKEQKEEILKALPKEKTIEGQRQESSCNPKKYLTRHNKGWNDCLKETKSLLKNL